jgi:hypothetical protein
MKYFTDKELACKGTGVVLLDPLFEQELPKLREVWGKQLIPTSVCRTPEHNKAVGGHPNSLHLTINPTHKTKGCCAADIRWNNWSKQDRLAFARLAFSMGWSVGLHNTFIHIDRRDAGGLPQAVFLYGTWNNEFKIEDVRNVK